jgi:hypothetical protein
MTSPHLLGWYGPTEAPWSSLLGHFRHVEPVALEGLAGWFERTTQESQRPPVLLAVLEHRSDPRWLQIQSQWESWQSDSRTRGWGEPKVALILGGDWQGHRRTMPLPEGVESAYWFQWYDRVMPWVAQAMTAPIQLLAKERDPSRKGAVKTARGKKASAADSVGLSPVGSGAAVATRQQRILSQTAWLRSRREHLGHQNRLAWVITDCVSHQEVWIDSLQAAGVRGVATRWDDTPPRLQPDLIVFDTSSHDAWSEQGASMSSLDVWPMIRCHESETTLAASVAQVRRRYPTAMLAVVEPFPDWNRWLAWKEQGIDVVLPRPCSMEGFLFTWGLHLESAPNEDAL